jgi:hypothetical protein
VRSGEVLVDGVTIDVTSTVRVGFNATQVLARLPRLCLGIQLFRESTTRRSASTSRIRRTRPSTCPSRRSWSPKSSGSRQRPFGVGKP